MEIATQRRIFVPLLVTLVTATALLIGGAANAQEEEADTAWHGTFDLGISANIGTTDSFAGTLFAETKKAWHTNELNFTLDVAYGFTNDSDNGDSLTADYQRATGKYKRFLPDLIADQVYWFLQGQVGRNNIQEIQYNTLVDSGLGWRFWEVDEVQKNFWEIEGGIGYRYDNYQLPSIFDNLEDRSLVNGRLASEVRRAFSVVEVGAATAFHLPFNDTNAWFFDASSFMDVPLSESWKLTSRLTLNYLNDPPGDADKSNLLISAGLGYTF